MIIIFSNSAINQNAQDALLAVQDQHVFSLEDISKHAQKPLDIMPKDAILTILELNANGNVQKLYSPHVLARRLYSLGFLDHIDTIQLLLSDIIPEKSMLAFANELSYAIIVQKSDSNIAIRVPASMNQCTLIQPPTDSDENWKLYTISPSKIKHPSSKDGAFHFYQDQMGLSYTGSIAEILENPIYTISAEKVKKTYSDNFARERSSFDFK